MERHLRPFRPPTSFSAPAVCGEAHSSVGSPSSSFSAVDASGLPSCSVDRSEYYSYYAAMQLADRPGLPTPRYWTRFAGRIPPTRVLQRLHHEVPRRGDTAFERSSPTPPLGRRLVHHGDPTEDLDVEVDPRQAVSRAAEIQPGADDGPQPPLVDEDHGVLAAIHTQLFRATPHLYETREHAGPENPNDPSLDGEDAETPPDPPTRPPSPRGTSDGLPSGAPSSHVDLLAAILTNGQHERHTRVSGALATVARQFSRFRAARRAQRVVAAAHLVQLIGVGTVVGLQTPVPDLPPSASLFDSVAAEGGYLRVLLAVLFEYECRLHAENWALRDIRAPLRRALLSIEEIPATVALGPRDAGADVAHVPNLLEFVGAENMDTLRRVLDRAGNPRHAAVVDRTIVAQVAAERRSVLTSADSVNCATPSSSAQEGLSLLSTDEELAAALGQVPYVPDRPAPADQRRPSTSAPSAHRTATRTSTPPPPLNSEEQATLSDLGIQLDERDEQQRILPSQRTALPGTKASVRDRQELPHTSIAVPRGFDAVEYTTDAATDRHVQAFAELGGFVDLDQLRQTGEWAAAISRPSKTAAASRQSQVGSGAASPPLCVVCELDSIGTVQCPCGNRVHPECGDPGPAGSTRCCRACTQHRWA